MVNDSSEDDGDIVTELRVIMTNMATYGTLTDVIYTEGIELCFILSVSQYPSWINSKLE